MRELRAHTAKVISLDFSPDGSRLVSADRTGRVLLWDAVVGTALAMDRIPDVDLTVPGVAFAPDGSSVLVSGANTCVWSPAEASFRELGSVGGGWGGSRIAIRPDGARFAVSNPTYGTGYSGYRGVHFWSWPKLGWVHVPDREFTSGSLSYSPDGRFLAVGRVEEWHGGDGPYRYWVQLHDAETHVTRNHFDGPTAAVTELAFSPAGRHLVGIAGITLLIWDVTTGTVLARPKVGRLHFTGLSFTPNGRFLLTTSNDQSVRAWETDTWTEHRAFEWRVGRAKSIAVAPDGVRAAVGGDTGLIVIWDLDV